MTRGQQECILPPPKVVMHPPADPLSLRCERRTTTLAWINTGTGETSLAQEKLQHRLPIGTRQDEGKGARDSRFTANGGFLAGGAWEEDGCSDVDKYQNAGTIRRDTGTTEIGVSWGTA